MAELTDKVAIVTGGGGGIGGAVARFLGSEGARVVVNDLPASTVAGQSAAERVAGQINAAGGEAIPSHTAVGPWDGGEKLVGETVEAFGRVDSVILCAGNFAPTLLLDLEQDEWQSLIAVHMTGQLTVSQAAARQMVTQGSGGHIVTFASRAAFAAPTPAYAAAKAGVMGMSSAMSRDLSQYGITVNCVLPSAQTPLFPGDVSSRPSGGGTPRPADIDPSSLAPLVGYLASDAAGDITGKFVYAAGSDFCFYDAPLVIGNRQTFVRKAGRWTLDELSATVPALVSPE